MGLGFGDGRVRTGGIRPDETHLLNIEALLQFHTVRLKLRTRLFLIQNETQRGVTRIPTRTGDFFQTSK